MKITAANENLILIETDYEIKTTPSGIVYKEANSQDELVVGKLQSKGPKASPIFTEGELLLFEKCSAVEYYDGEVTHFIIDECFILAKME